MVMVVANPDARGNIMHGRAAWRRGLRGAYEVYCYHLRWNRGIAADYHFERGYIEAANADNLDPRDPTVREALRLFDAYRLTAEDKHLQAKAWRATTGTVPYALKAYDYPDAAY
jgi:hypothetical protein